MNPWTKAMTLPEWKDSGLALPPGVEARRDGDLAALVLIGTDKVVGFVPSRFDKANLPGLLARLGIEGTPSS